MVFVGDDWAEGYHDVELVDGQGRRLARAKLSEGLDGITRLHALIAQHMPDSWADLDPAEAAVRVRIGIETDRGPWVQALVAAGDWRAGWIALALASKTYRHGVPCRLNAAGPVSNRPRDRAGRA